MFSKKVIKLTTTLFFLLIATKAIAQYSGDFARDNRRDNFCRYPIQETIDFTPYFSQVMKGLLNSNMLTTQNKPGFQEINIAMLTECQYFNGQCMTKKVLEAIHFLSGFDSTTEIEHLEDQLALLENENQRLRNKIFDMQSNVDVLCHCYTESGQIQVPGSGANFGVAMENARTNCKRQSRYSTREKLKIPENSPPGTQLCTQLFR